MPHTLETQSGEKTCPWSSGALRLVNGQFHSKAVASVIVHTNLEVTQEKAPGMAGGAFPNIEEAFELRLET